jgi:hypothetical protein
MKTKIIYLFLLASIVSLPIFFFDNLMQSFTEYRFKSESKGFGTVPLQFTGLLTSGLYDAENQCAEFKTDDHLGKTLLLLSSGKSVCYCLDIASVDTNLLARVNNNNSVSYTCGKWPNARVLTTKKVPPQLSGFVPAGVIK